MVFDNEQNVIEPAIRAPRVDRALTATGEGSIPDRSSETYNDDPSLNSIERHGFDTSQATSGRGQRYLNIATWNVRTMNECGKLQQVRMEAERLSLDVLGLAEVRWKSSGQVNTNGWMFYYIGDDKVHQRGVGFLLAPKTVKAILKVQPISDRIIMIRLDAKPQPLTIIQIYMPTTEAEDDEVFSIYAILQKVVDECPKKDRLVVMGDFNAQIGANREHLSCGKFSVGEGNDRGQMLLDWLSDNKLIAVNTCFQHRKNQLYTWCSPGGQWKNQIDFITTRLRDRRECKDSRSLRSADCGSDHQLVWMKLKGRSWNKKKQLTKKLKLNLVQLKDPATAAAFELSVRNHLKDKDVTWPVLASALNSATKEYCPVVRKTEKPWIHDPDCQELIHQRRQAKINNFQGTEYRKLCKSVKTACRKAKRKWLAGLSAKAEQSHRSGNIKRTYQLIKQISAKKTPQPGIGIKDKNGDMLYETDSIKDRWSEYGSQLFKSDLPRHHADEHPPDALEPEIMPSEIRAAIRKLKIGKAPGQSGICAEMIKAGGETVVQAMKTIIDNIWNTGVWPSDWTRSEIIALPKVPGTQDCSKHRTISLLCHASKVLLEIIRSRLAHFVMPQIAEEQFGFVAGKGTTDAILTIRNIIEKTVKRQDQQLWLMFIDYSKAFDTVNHAALWKTLLDFGAPKHLVWLLERLYSEATGVIRVADDHSDEFPFEKGVRQGCTVSPLLFNACGEAIMRQVKETLDERPGSIVGGRAIWNIRYADDTTLLARSKTELEKQAAELMKGSLTFGLHINPTKTHVMAHGSKEKIVLGRNEIKQVERFKYLGSLVSIDGDSTPEICARLALAKNVTSQLIGLWKAKEISLKLKKQLVKSLVWSVALYGAESWSLKLSDMKKIESFELWVWRRMLQVSWKDRRTNEWIRQRVGVTEKEGLLAHLKKRKLSMYGHWKRRSGSLVQMTVEGEVEGKARPGRRKTAWIDNIRKWTDGGMPMAREKAVKRMPTVL